MVHVISFVDVVVYVFYDRIQLGGPQPCPGSESPYGAAVQSAAAFLFNLNLLVTPGVKQSANSLNDN